MAETAGRDIIEMLIADHRTADELFDRFEKLDDDDDDGERQETVERIIRHLTVHIAVEEQVFYPRVRQLGTEVGDEALEGLEEHHLLKITMAELEGMQPSDERFDAKVDVLIEQARHHHQEEEEELFPDVRERLDAATLRERRRRARPGRPLSAGRGRRGEWVLDASTELSPAGVGVSHSLLSDRQGSVGHGLQALPVDRR
jgi:hemerythrin superfamily protein